MTTRAPAVLTNTHTQLNWLDMEYHIETLYHLTQPYHTDKNTQNISLNRKHQFWGLMIVFCMNFGSFRRNVFGDHPVPCPVQKWHRNATLRTSNVPLQHQRSREDNTHARADYERDATHPHKTYSVIAERFAIWSIPIAVSYTHLTLPTKRIV